MQNYNKVIITAWHWIKIYTEEYLYLSSVCQYQTPKILIASSISFFIIILFWIFIATHNIMLSVPYHVGLSIFGSVRFLTKKQPNRNYFFSSFWTEPNRKPIRTEPKTDSNRPCSVRFGFFPFQTNLNRKLFLGFFIVHIFSRILFSFYF